MIVIAIMQAFSILLRARMGVLSVANTSVLWWGQGLGSEAEEEASVEASTGLSSPGLTKPITSEYSKDHRLLATCESGPPLEVRVPELETIGWDRLVEQETGESLSDRRGKWDWWKKWTLPRVQEVSSSQTWLTSGLDDGAPSYRPRRWIADLLLHVNV
jgi:hypothetical protein